MPIENEVSFNLSLTKFAKTLKEEDFIKFHKRIVIEAVTRITARTPVDTGRARSNWITTQGETTERVHEGDEDFPNEKDVVQQSVAALQNLGFGEVVYIQNNVEYIIFLEEGRPGAGSLQAPQGMVAITFEELRDFIGG